MKFHRSIQVAKFAVCVGSLLVAPATYAQNTPPWWQQLVKQATQKAENAVIHGFPGQNTGTSTGGNSTTSIASQSPAGAPSVSSMSPSVLLPFTKQTIVFRGSGFGTLEPFNGHICALQFVDITNKIGIGGVPREFVNPQSGVPLGASDGTFYVTKWTDSEVIIKGIYGGLYGSIADFRPGDLVRIEIANPQKFNEYPNHGLCGSPAARLFTHVASSLPGPKISSFSDGGTPTPVSGSSTTSVSTILPVAKQTITINGSGFGEHAPFQGYSRFLQLTDITANNWTSGASCANGCGSGPSVDVKSWTDNQVVLGGFINGYGGEDVLHPGDIVRISIANPQLAGDMGSANSTFGGSPATQIFVNVANATQSQAQMVPPSGGSTSAASSNGGQSSLHSTASNGSATTPPGNSTESPFLTFYFAPAGEAYMVWDAARLTKFRQELLNGLGSSGSNSNVSVQVGIRPDSGAFDGGAISAAALLTSIPTAGAELAQSFVEIGAIGATATTAKLTFDRYFTPLPPEEANAVFAWIQTSITDKVEKSILNNSSHNILWDGQPVHDLALVAGPSQEVVLQVAVPSLSAGATVDLGFLANAQYGLVPPSGGGIPGPSVSVVTQSLTNSYLGASGALVRPFISVIAMKGDGKPLCGVHFKNAPPNPQALDLVEQLINSGTCVFALGGS